MTKTHISKTDNTNTMTTSIFNLPNNLTIARILMIPVFVAIAYWPPALGINLPVLAQSSMSLDTQTESTGHVIRHLLLTFIFVIAAFTDWLDGYLARKMQLTSAFGSFLDPVADKLMVSAALIILAQWHANIIMAIFVITIISREIAVSALREWMAEIGNRSGVAVSYVGKLKTTFQMGAITLLLLNWEPLTSFGYAMMLVAVILTIWSMMIYIKAAWPYLTEANKQN